MLTVGRVSHVQAMMKKHAQAVRDFVQDEQGQEDDEELVATSLIDFGDVDR